MFCDSLSVVKNTTTDKEEAISMTSNLQEVMLNQMRKNETFITVFLLNGFQLKGTLKSYDNFTVLLQDGEGNQHLIYKHAISTFLPSETISYSE